MMTQSSKKKVRTLEATDVDHFDAGHAEEAVDVLSVDHLTPALPAVSEGEELGVEGRLAATNQSISRHLDAPSWRPDKVIVNLRTLMNADTPDLDDTTFKRRGNLDRTKTSSPSRGPASSISDAAI